ncbi:MAG: rhomboid family intramembrane serine protease [Candidatus Nanohalobium sp.]
MKRPKFLTGTNLLLLSIIVASFMEFIGMFSRTSYWLSPEMFFAGKYYILITNSFVHGGLAHLFFNSITIYVFGNLVESRIGVLRTYLVFFVGGIVSGLVWVLTMSVPALGASDGAFALIAAAVLLVPRKRITATVPGLNKFTSYRVIANFSTVLGVAALVQILFMASFATGSAAIGLIAKAFSVFDPVMSIFINIKRLGGSSNVARISHVIGFATGSLLAYLTDKEEAVSNLKVFTIYMVFFLVFYLSSIFIYKMLGFLGMIGLTLYITPEIRKNNIEKSG